MKTIYTLLMIVFTTSLYSQTNITSKSYEVNKLNVTYVTQEKDTIFVQNDTLGHLIKNIWVTTEYNGKKPIIVEVDNLEKLIATRNRPIRYSNTYKN